MSGLVFIYVHLYVRTCVCEAIRSPKKKTRKTKVSTSPGPDKTEVNENIMVWFGLVAAELWARSSLFLPRNPAACHISSIVYFPSVLWSWHAAYQHPLWIIRQWQPDIGSRISFCHYACKGCLLSPLHSPHTFPMRGENWFVQRGLLLVRSKPQRKVASARCSEGSLP